MKDFADVRFIHLTMVDNAGIVRLKMIPIDRLEHVAEFGVGISTVLGVFTIDDHVAYLPGRPGLEGPAGDMRMVPDLDAAVSLGDGIAWAPVDQIHQDGTTLPTCQRSLLRRIQADAAGKGLGFKVAFEVEFTLLGDGVHTWPAFSAAGLLEVEDFATDLVDALEEMGLHVQQIQAEAGHPHRDLRPVSLPHRLLLAVESAGVRRHHRDFSAFQPAPQTLDIFGLLELRAAREQVPVLPLEHRVIEHEVLYTRLGQHRHSARLRRANDVRAFAGRHVDNVELTTRRLAPPHGALDRLRLDEVRPRHRMQARPVLLHHLGRVMPGDQLVEHAG